MNLLGRRPARLAVLLLCLTPFPGRAAPSAWHQVEVIVFSHLQPEVGGEVWPVNPGMPQAEFSIELLTAAPPSEPALSPEDAPLRPYLALGQERRRLGGIYRRLRLSAEYRPLLHAAWLQPALRGRSTRAVRLDSNLFEQSAATRPELTWAELAGGWSAPASPGLGRSEPPGWRPFYRPPQLRYDGFVRLRSARFLHLDIDFAYFLAPDEGGSGAALTLGGEARADYARLTESRRVRLNEIHYFDHPLFGLIVQVSLLKIAPPPEAGAEP